MATKQTVTPPSPQDRTFTAQIAERPVVVKLIDPATRDNDQVHTGSWGLPGWILSHTRRD